MIGASPEQFIENKIDQIRAIEPWVNTLIGTPETAGLSSVIARMLDSNAVLLERFRGGIYLVRQTHSSHSWDPTTGALLKGDTEKYPTPPFKVSFIDNRCGQIAEVIVVKII